MVVGGKCQSKRTEEENCQETKANCEVCSRESLGRALEKDVGRRQGTLHPLGLLSVSGGVGFRGTESKRQGQYNAEESPIKEPLCALSQV